MGRNMPPLPYDFKDHVEINVNFMYFFGIMRPKLDTKLENFLHNVRVAVLSGFMFGGIMSAELANLYYSFGDLEQLMRALFLTLSNLVSIAKFHAVWRNQRRILDLIDAMNVAALRPRSGRQLAALGRYARLGKALTLGCAGAVTATCAFWAVYPFTDDDGPFLPIPAYVPFDVRNSTFRFALVYSFEIVATAVGGQMDLAADCLMAVLLMTFCAQLNVLNDSLVNLQPMETNRTKSLVKNMNEKLVHCIRQHRLIIEFTETWSGMFTYAIFSQFVVSVFVICATFFEMTQVPASSIRFFSMALYQMCMFLEIYPICYYGNEVIKESDKLTDSAYHCDWSECPLEFQKNLVFFMTRSQRPIKLYAGNFFALSLETFIKILKSSWSFVAVLIQVNNDKID
ncbi:unnamed protein product [Phyllotreta striolata]|uniref:Odorant receptor n=1 Tax=Phyllotreta striolata TaxID=444603 RepID=A0A9N9TJ52_PHYSR|nr:unnamed protein product [Phyllotreta striolata]